MGGMADPKRSGCGCLLPGLLLLILAPLLAGLFVVPVRDGQFRPGLGILAVFLVAGVVAAVVRSRSSTMPGRSDGGDGSGRQEVPSSPISDDPPIPPGVLAPPPPPTRPGRRATTSAPLDPGTAALRDRLAEAVADLSDEGTTPPIHQGITSEEMIARAKRRIREWSDD